MICPKCKETLTKVNNSYKCVNNHSYDISKYGYVNLLLSKTNCGDPLESIKARNNFLSKDYYKPLANKIQELIVYYNNSSEIKNILDCGCGTGYYSSSIQKVYPNRFNITGTDISKDAIMYASKKDKLSSYIVASSASLPLEANTFDFAYIVFAPLFEEELSRVLKPNGIFIRVSPNVKHLYELKEKIYDNPYLNEPEVLNLSCFEKLESLTLTYNITTNSADIQDLVGMTPYFYKTSKENLERLNNVNSLDITIDFIIEIYKKAAN